jgi:hypothetical protein
VWCTYTGTLVDVPQLPAWAPPLNLAAFVAASYGLYYVILEPFAGVRACSALLDGPAARAD